MPPRSGDGHRLWLLPRVRWTVQGAIPLEWFVGWAWLHDISRSYEFSRGPAVVPSRANFPLAARTLKLRSLVQLTEQLSLLKSYIVYVRYQSIDSRYLIRDERIAVRGMAMAHAHKRRFRPYF